MILNYVEIELPCSTKIKAEQNITKCVENILQNLADSLQSGLKRIYFLTQLLPNENNETDHIIIKFEPHVKYSINSFRKIIPVFTLNLRFYYFLKLTILLFT